MALFPSRLKLLREEKNLTLEGLADELSISKSLLWDLEQGRRRVHGELLLKIAHFFNVSSDYLLGLSENRTEKDTGSETFIYELDPETVQILGRVKELSPRGREQLRRAVEWVFEVDERERKSRRGKGKP